MIKIALVCALLAGCADVPTDTPARSYNCPDLPLATSDQTTRGYLYQVIDMYIACRKSVINHG